MSVFIKKYTDMKQIQYDISDKLYIELTKIKENIEIEEQCDVNYSELIEEAILEYFNIKLSDFNDISDLNEYEILNNISLNSQYYVYAYYDLSKPCKLDVELYSFNFEPLYIGVSGDVNRINNIRNRNNLLLEKCNDLINKNELGKKIIFRNLTKTEAFEIESNLIKSIGRIDIGTGPLYNKNNGNTNQKRNQSSFLECKLIKHILFVLNNTKTIKRAAKKLNISERTLYRKIKTHNLTKNNNKIWIINNNF